jgi:aldehyde dehydrogenase (NAD+)
MVTITQPATADFTADFTAEIAATLDRQRQFFATGKTRDLDFRIAQLTKLRRAIQDRQAAIVAAVQQDLGRPEYEAYFELASVTEIDGALKNLKTWAKPRRAALSIDQLPGKAWIEPQPLGVALIIGPWNYPISLAISPLVGAIAAGNCAIVKPSEVAPASSAVVAELIRDTFDPEFVAVFEGDAATSQALLACKFDHVFFTGGTQIGRIVMEAAAKHLTPVTLELGGKSPCFVAADANLAIAAKRIAWGKFLNAGQTCIAPDYLLVDRAIAPALLAALKGAIAEFYGPDPASSSDYGRIINERQFDRLVSLLGSGQVLVGGQHNRGDRYIAPTILTEVAWDSPVMADEIFGPILPVMVYDNLDQAIAQVNSRPKPLALYVFSESKTTQRYLLDRTSSGGACINETIMHVGCPSLPFGGVGDSGIGSYHGKASFDTFSHYRSVLKKPTWLDLDWRYAPYGNKVATIKKLLGMG